MIVISIDPGTTKSAWVLYNGMSVLRCGIEDNDVLLAMLREETFGASVLLIERIASYGMAVGEEVFATVFVSGRFAEAWHPKRFDRLFRRDIKQHLCHTARATDSNIRQALIDRFGGSASIGTKKDPGQLYGVKAHAWSALAVAITWMDLYGHLPEEVRPGVRAEF